MSFILGVGTGVAAASAINSDASKNDLNIALCQTLDTKEATRKCLLDYQKSQEWSGGEIALVVVLFVVSIFIAILIDQFS